MKPLKLKMCAFGPFAGETVIDFRRIAENGIFLISGNTGAGKTTIFDAISYALYGNASGDGRDAKSIRSDFAKSDCETYVELTFLHRGKEYKVFRKPEQERAKKRGGGVTTTPAEAVFMRPDGSVVTRYKDVTGEIIELLGIDYAQFKQIVMIAQGEFRKLLTADSSARAEIFRKLFGTDDLKRLQERLSTRSYTARQRCDELRNSIDQYIAGIKFDEENAYSKVLGETIEARSALSVSEILKLLGSMNQEEKSIFEAVSREYEAADKAYEHLSGELLTAQKDNRDIELYERILESLKLKDEEKPALDEEDKAVKLSRTAIYEVYPFEERENAAGKQVLQFEEDGRRLAGEKSVCEKNLSNAESKVEGLKDSSARRDLLSTKINALETDMSKYSEIEKLSKNKNQLEAETADIKNQLEELANERQGLEEESERLDKNIVREYSGSEVKLAEVNNEKNNIGQKLNSLNELSEKTDRLIRMSEQIEKAQCDCLKTQENYQEALEEYRTKDKMYYDSQAGILAAKLKQDTPCPVCGSIHHPNPTKLSDKAITKEELELAEKKSDMLRNRREESLSVLNELKANVSAESEALIREIKKVPELFKKLDGGENAGLKERLQTEKGAMLYAKIKDTIEATVSEAEADFENADTLIARLEEQICEIKRASEKIEIVKKELENNICRKDELNNRLSEKNNALSETSSRLELLKSQMEYVSEGDAAKHLKEFKDERNFITIQLEKAVQEVNDSRQKLSAAEALLKKNAADVEEAHRNYETAAKNYHEAILANGFDSEAEYKSFLITKPELEEKESGISEWYEEYKGLNNDKKTYHERTKDLVYKNLEEIESKKNASYIARSEADERRNQINLCLQNNLEVYSVLAEKSEEFRKAQKEFELSQLLSKTANGELQGKEKLRFEQYVQGVYFKQVLAQANKRLNRMSSGQYTLLKRDEALDGRKTSGLEIDVLDHYTGKARSAASLSGGESFKAALALALGLSDVIQNNNGGIDVDVMFIDEGFGSLDQDSLELAVNVLQELSNGNRLIGIISHVSELKERIEKQLVIEKTSMGSRIESGC